MFLSPVMVFIASNLSELNDCVWNTEQYAGGGR
jgi:hypothetical protein